MIPPASPTKFKKSKLPPIFLTIVSGLLLAGGSCFGFLNTFNYKHDSSPISTIFAFGFAAGVLAVLTGIVWAIVAVVLSLLRAKKEQS